MSVDPKSQHYDHGGIETIDVIKAKLTTEQYQGYLLGNVLKYASRLNWKGSSERDAEKLSLYAMWLHEEFAPPPEERQQQVEERHGRFDDLPPHTGMSLDRDDVSDRPPDRPLASHCPDGGACRHKCGLGPCQASMGAA